MRHVAAAIALDAERRGDVQALLAQERRPLNPASQIDALALAAGFAEIIKRRVDEIVATAQRPRSKLLVRR